MRRVAVICAITAFAFIGPPVWASLCVLDQHQENQGYLYEIPDDGILPQYEGFSYGVGGPTLMAQTFRAGVDGTLCYIQIGNTSGVTYYDASPPVVQIYQGLPLSPNVTPLGEFILSNPLPTDGWTSPIYFPDSTISMTAGRMYSIVLSADYQSGAVSVGAIGTGDPPPSLSQDPAGWLYPDRTDPWLYPGGALWAWDGDAWLLLGSNVFDQPVFDMQFRTYVQAVPLPAGVWLGICAVSVAGWHLKRQRG